MDLWRLFRSQKEILKQDKVGDDVFKILVLGYEHDTSTKMFVGNFKEVLDPSYSIQFRDTKMIRQIDLYYWDIIIFSRTFDSNSLLLQQQATQFRKPVIYMLDDDLLGVYEHEQFRAFAPGTIIYYTIEQQIKHADLVITYSAVTTEVVKQLNDKVITLKTNILGKYVNGVLNTPSTTPLRFVYAGTSTKKDEFKQLWPAFQQISSEKQEAIEFHFWGLDVNDLPALHSQVHLRPYLYGYGNYIESLKSAGFHVMLAPLFDRIRAQTAKCPIKFLEAIVAGSIGIYSDVLPYKDISHRVTGLKTLNTTDDWYTALKTVCELNHVDRSSIFEAAKSHVISEYTTESLVPVFVHALQDAQHNAITRFF